MRYLFLILLSTLFLNSASVNQALLDDKNSTVYDSLLRSVQNSTNPQTKLQKTLILKIKNLSKEIKTPKIDITKIKDQKHFIDSFFNLVEAKVQNQSLKKSITDIKKRADSLKDEIKALDDNASNLLTLQLQYAYFYKKLKILENTISNFEQDYQNNIDLLIKNIKNIKFNSKKTDKNIKLFRKKISIFQKDREKLLIEKERYKLLENQNAFNNTARKITNIENKIDLLIKSIIKNRLIKFFEKLSRKKDTLFENIHEISQEAKSLFKNPDEYQEVLQNTLNYIVKQTLGDSKAYLYKLKEMAFSVFTQKSLFNIPLYKFAGGFGIFLIFLVFRKLFTLIVIKTLRHIVSRTKTSVDDKILDVITGPLKFAFIIIGLYFGFEFMGILNETIAKIIKTLIIFSVFWVFYDAVSTFESVIYKFAKNFGKELYREIGTFIIKTLKIFVFTVGLVAILQEWSINVSAFIASLGLGGLAFALAAKDTASNLFGGLSILADNALKIDDWIKVGSVEGTVEDIGLRTTKIRTFEKSLVTVPNQIIANNPIENFSRRGIRRIKMRVGVTYSTSRESMENILKDIKEMLKSHPSIAQNATMLVNFDRFEDSSLSIFIYTFTNTAVWADYMHIREDVNLKIMKIIEKYQDSDFAFPSQSLYVEKLPESKRIEP